jgi:hypothetical protein
MMRLVRYLLAVVGCCTPAHAQFTQVQSSKATSTTGAVRTMDIALDREAIPGNLLVVAVSGYYSPVQPVLSVTDNRGGQWRPVTTLAYGTATTPNQVVSLWYATPRAPGTSRITVAATQGLWMSVGVAEYAAPNGAVLEGYTTAFDTANAANGLAVPAIATAGDSDVVFGLAGTRANGVTWTPGAGYADVASFPGVAGRGGSMLLEARTGVPPPGARPTAAMAPSNSYWGMVGAAFRGLPPGIVSAAPRAMLTGPAAVAVELKGSGTGWTETTPFTLRGPPGCAIESKAVLSGTMATFSIRPGAAGGPLTISDGVYSTTLEVVRPYSGSLRFAGQTILHDPGGTSFSRRGEASLAFFLRVNSDAGLNLATGTRVLSFSTGGSAVTLDPATRTLSLVFNASPGGTVAWRVPIQPGVGYHFAISWQSGRQVLYVNGLPYGTAFALAAPTADQVGIRVGGDGGAGIAIDHSLSDLAIWSDHALTAEEAAALAAGAITPLATARPATSWWTLGGEAGTTPAAGDIGLADLSGGPHPLVPPAGTFAGAGDIYEAFHPRDPPAILAPVVTKSGTLLVFRAAGGAAAANGYHPDLPIAGVDADPTVYRDGRAIAIGPATWTSGRPDASFVAYLLRCGSVRAVALSSWGVGYTGPPSVAIDETGTGGSGLVLGAPAMATGVVAYRVDAPGSGYTAPPAVTVAPPPGTSGPLGNLRAGAVAVLGDGGRVVAVVPRLGVVPGEYGGPGTGYAADAPPPVTIAGDGGARATAIVGPYVAAIPVISGGSGYDRPPRITLSGGGATEQAAAAPIMTGVKRGEALTYSAPASWLTPTIDGRPAGGLQAVTLAPVVNSAGSLEAGTPFAEPPRIVAGGHPGHQPAERLAPTFVGENQVDRVGMWGLLAGSTGVITYRPDNRTPASWTDPDSTTLQAVVYGPASQNKLDSTQMPAYLGDFTLIYDDPAVNTAGASAVRLGYVWADSRVAVTPVPQSGDGSPVAIPAGNVTISGGRIAAVSLEGVAFGPGYRAAGVLVSGGGGSGFAGTVIVRDGRPASVNVICPGRGYQSAGLAATVYGIGLEGRTVTQVFRFAHAMPNPAYWSPDVTLWVARRADPGGTAASWNLGDPWVISPGHRPARGRRLALDQDVRADLTAADGRPVGVLRYLDRIASSGGVEQYILPSDLPAGTSGAYPTILNARTTTVDFAYARYLNTNPADTAHPWVSVKCYSPQAWAASGVDLAFTRTATLAAGSPVVVPETMADLMVGATVAGAGIPDGALVASLGAHLVGTTDRTATVRGIASTANLAAGMTVVGLNVAAGTTVVAVGAGSITLSTPATGAGTAVLAIGAERCFTLGSPDGGLAAATAGGSGVPLSITNPGYVTLPPGDCGYFAGNMQTPAAVLELRSTRPHGFASGQDIWIKGDAGVPYTGPTLTAPGWNAAAEVAGTITAGSPVITGVANAQLHPAGAALYGAGVPAGTRIASTRPAANEITMTAPATAAGTSFIVSALAPVATEGARAYVTGPCTLVVNFYLGPTARAPAPGGPGGPQVVNATAEVPLAGVAYPRGWNVWTRTPRSVVEEPYEFQASAAAELPGSAIWVNLPNAASDATIGLIARKIAAHAGPSTTLYLEHSNEDWNRGGAFSTNAYLVGVSTLYSYLGGGTVDRVPAPLALPTGLSGFGPASVLGSSHAYEAFRAAWQRAGRDPARLRLIQGGWWQMGSNARAMLSLCQRFGVTPDYYAVAPYQDMPSDPPIVRAFSPAGSATPDAGNWPIDAINDFSRFYVAYSLANTSGWEQAAAACRNFGQPLNALAVAGVAGGSLEAGNYYLYYTYADAAGLETTVGLSRSYPIPLAGDRRAIRATVPEWPAWAASMRIYVSAPGAAAGSLIGASYLTVPCSQPVGTSPNPPGTTIVIAGRPAATGSPPTVNRAGARAAATPRLACYEGSQTTMIPRAVPLQYHLQHDSLLHPSARDLVYGWFAAVQAGCPWVPDSGADVACYFQIYGYGPSYPFIWHLSLGAAQRRGTGAGNRFATVQGGAGAASDLGHDHNRGSTSPGYQGLMDFVGASRPGPAAPPVRVPAAAPRIPAIPRKKAA